MKTIITILLFIPLFASAQKGTISYSYTTQFQFKGSEEFPDLAASFPKERVTSAQLYFNEKASYYENLDDQNPDQVNHNEGNMELVIKIDVPQYKIFQDLDKNQKIERKEFMGKYFLIDGKRKKFNWKIESGSQEIAGYLCQKATHTDSTSQITAYFTTEIPVSTGPGEFNGLPGAILKVSIDNDQRVYEATKVEIGKLDESALTPPTKGKKVTQSEFDAIVEKKMQEMGAEKNKNGFIMITTEEQN